MATVDPSTLALDYVPLLSRGTGSNITSTGGGGLPTVNVPKDTSTGMSGALAGALIGGLLGNKAGTNPLGQALNKITGGAAPKPSAGSAQKPAAKPTVNTPVGSYGSVVNVTVPKGIPASEAQNWLDQNYGTTNGQSNYIASGINMTTGEVIGTQNLNIGGANLGTNTGNFGFTADGTGAADPLSSVNQYYQDSTGNIYQDNGDGTATLIYGADTGYTYTPNDYAPGYEDYTPTTDAITYQDSVGNVYDSGGNLIYYGSDYWSGGGSGSSFSDPYLDTSTVDQTAYYTPIDTGSYYPDWTAKKGGLATPLFKRGGQAKHFADGGFIDQVVANQVPGSTTTGSTTTGSTTTDTTAPTTTSTSTTDTTGGSDTGLLNTIGSLLSNGGVQGALVGSLLGQLLSSSGSSTAQNPGVDMSKVGVIAPRTTSFGMGPTPFVPYSDYGTPPSSSTAYGGLNANLGVSGFDPNKPSTWAATPSYTFPTPTTTPTTTTPTTAGTGTGGLPTTTGGTTTGTTTGGTTTGGTTTGGTTTGGTTTGTTTGGTTTGGTTTGGTTTGGTTTGGTTTGGTTTTTSNVPKVLQDRLAELQKQLSAAHSANRTASIQKQIDRVNAQIAKYSTTTGTTTPTKTTTTTSSDNAPKTVDSSATTSRIADLKAQLLAATSQFAKDRIQRQIDILTHFGQKKADGGLVQYYSYGQPSSVAQNLGMAQNFGGLAQGGYAQGGPSHHNHAPNVPLVEDRHDYREGAAVNGEGDGQSDDIPAMLADGEYVIDAETVAQLGNGSNKAGARILDQFRENIRQHKRSAPINKIPPKSKSPLAYLKGVK